MAESFVKLSNEDANRRAIYQISLILVLMTVAAYMGVLQCGFVNYDDELYVTNNPHLTAGFTLGNVRWMLTTLTAGNWHPLTWLSFLLDAQILGIQPAGFHATNLILHVLGSVMLFLVFNDITLAQWRSAFVAALFALHPLHVESVAWVSERKDALSTFFWMLTMLAYARYARDSTSRRKYALVLAAFLLGLMSKPMLVTLPFVLLLLDYWPLARFGAGEHPFKEWRKLIVEKIPLFIMAIIFCGIAYYAQKSEGYMTSLKNMPSPFRVGNAAFAYSWYVKKMFWSSGLTVFYPHPGRSLAGADIAGALVFLACITLAVFYERCRKPYLLVGWLWYLGTLVPVIGIVQVGAQAMADRYTYIPLIGLFIMVSWGLTELVERWRIPPAARAGGACVALIALGAITSMQVTYWRDSTTLFRHALEVTQRNWLAHQNLAVALQNQGKINEAIAEYSQCLSISPGYAKAHHNLAHCLAKQGKWKQAADHYSKALQFKPGWKSAQDGLARALAAQKKIEKKKKPLAIGRKGVPKRTTR